MTTTNETYVEPLTFSGASNEDEPRAAEPIEKIHSERRQIGAQAVNALHEIIADKRDSMAMYLNEIGKVPLLNAEEEVELAKRIETGLVASKVLAGEGTEPKKKTGSSPSQGELEWLAMDGEDARKQLIEANLRLVVFFARKSKGGENTDLIDLIAFGNRGLMHTVEKFDYTEGYKFSTYAKRWIQQYITKGVEDEDRLIRISGNGFEEMEALSKVENMLRKRFDREPEIDEIASETGLSKEKIMEVKEWGKYSESLDAPIGSDEDSVTLGDKLASEVIIEVDDTIVPNELSTELLALVAKLESRDADIIRRRYGFKNGTPQSYKDIGSYHGLSNERIRQLDKAAVEVLKTLATEQLLSNP